MTLVNNGHVQSGFYNMSKETVLEHMEYRSML